MRLRRRARPVLALVLVFSMASLSACTLSIDRRLAEGAAEQITDTSFYELTEPVAPGDPGEIVRTEPIASAPDGTQAWRVLYHSRDVHGADIVVSGTVLAPDVSGTEAERSIVSWAHPTTGSAQHCAPSHSIDPFLLVEGARALVDAGYVVVAADYPGLGVAGPNSYLIGTSEGNSVLDMARAARLIPEAHAGADLLLWGHSQGGQAALFAGQDAASYAPELNLTAIAVAAPAANLVQLINDHLNDASGVTIGSYTFAAYVSVYESEYPGLSLDSILTQAGAAETPAMAELCLISQHPWLHADAEKLVGNFVKENPTSVEPWATLLAENTPGGKPLGVPLFVAQGEKDTLVLPAATAAFVAAECASGEHVIYDTIPQATHGTVALDAVTDVVKFFEAASIDAPPASTCP